MKAEVLLRGDRDCVFTGKGNYRTPWSISEKTARKQLKQVVEWGDGDCEHYPPDPDSKLFKKGTPRKDCPECWQDLKRLVE